MERSTLKRRSSSSDLESAKALRSSLILRPKVGSPLVMVCREKEGCGVYKPDEDRVYETKRDFSGYRFLGSSGKWFLVVDSGMKFYIIDVFSEEMIDLPPIESFKGTLFRLERLGENVRNILVRNSAHGLVNTAEDLRGRLWVDDKNGGDYVVVWSFQMSEYFGFCKKGDDHYREILKRGKDVHWQFRGAYDMVLRGHNLYIFVVREFIRHLDLSGGHVDGGDFKDVSESQAFPLSTPVLSLDERKRIKQDKVISSSESIAVTRSGQVLLVYTYELNSERQRMFHLYKRNPNVTSHATAIVEVDSLGDEALFLDLGTTVPADHSLGIEPNSIYFTRGDRIRQEESSSCLDICVFNLTTKTTKRFPTLSSLNVKDAHWFLPS
ncbi:F-box protein [Cardamine amara subsp. amara]|uniref:F-box protein n=1 Tax=Cardamine amara subsp. amara TaxID=228776 RepID=A0ABD1BKI1_CARAN